LGLPGGQIAPRDALGMSERLQSDTIGFSQEGREAAWLIELASWPGLACKTIQAPAGG